MAKTRKIDNSLKLPRSKVNVKLVSKNLMLSADYVSLWGYIFHFDLQVLIAVLKVFADGNSFIGILLVPYSSFKFFYWLRAQHLLWQNVTRLKWTFFGDFCIVRISFNDHTISFHKIFGGLYLHSFVSLIMFT